MISELFRKWFGLTPPSCSTCEVLRDQLEKSETERRELLHKLFESKTEPPSPPVNVEELKPLTPKFVPWRVRQQMLEQEDRQRARLMQDKAKEIDQLEQELGVSPTEG